MFSSRLKNFIIKDSQENQSQIKLFGMIMIVNYPLYFWLFDMVYSSDIKLSFIVRMIAVLLCIGLLCLNYNNIDFKKGLYWYVTVCYCLPFFFNFMTLLNHVSAIWLMNYMSAIFFMMLIVDFPSFILLFFIGNLLSFFTYISLYKLIIINLGEIGIFDIFFTIFAAWVIGSLFNRNNTISQLHKLETLKALGGTIAHELRTPVGALGMKGKSIALQAIKLLDIYKLAKSRNLEVLEIPEKEVKKIEDSYQDIENVTNESLLIIDMLLTKLKDPSQISNKEYYSAKKLIEEALARYPLYENQKDLIKLDLDQDFDLYINKTLFTHVIFNLLKNALHYIRQANKGEIIISLKTNEKGYNVFYFTDTSKGIEPTVLPYIFEKFRSKTEHGTGLGLAFCKLVMEESQGKIYCESIYGEYTKFILKFLAKSDS